MAALDTEVFYLAEYNPNMAEATENRGQKRKFIEVDYAWMSSEDKRALIITETEKKLQFQHRLPLHRSLMLNNVLKRAMDDNKRQSFSDEHVRNEIESCFDALFQLFDEK